MPRAGHSRGRLRVDAAVYGLDLDIAGTSTLDKPDSPASFIFRDSKGTERGRTSGIRQAEIFLEGVALGWQVASEQLADSMRAHDPDHGLYHS